MECGGVAEGGSGWDKYPERPINLVICYSPGGGSDVMWNLVKPFIERELNATFVPIYKPGANGAVGWTYLVKETQPDGYTIAVGNTPPIVGNPIMSPECQYTMDDIVPIYNIVDDPGILVVAASSPIKTFEDFIKYAKENPGKASVATLAWVVTIGQLRS
jgi:tripartite-type tricarboxylate transporter receptor subunit TctC